MSDQKEQVSVSALSGVASASGDWEQVYRGLRIRAFVLTWLAYALFYLCRTPYAIVKGTMARTFGLDTVRLGYIDTGYLSLYAIGQFANGVIGDRIGGRLLVGIGLLGTALLFAAFGSGHSYLIFVLAYGLNGYFQSAGWPGCAKTFSQWFSTEERGTVMGFWCTCYQAGAVVSALMATWLLVHFGWRSSLLVPALVVGGYAFFFLALQPVSPEREGLPDVEVYYTQTTGKPLLTDASGGSAVGAWSDTLLVLKSRVIWTLGLTYVILKFIRYSFLFWLPFYMSHSLHYPEGEAGYTFLVFELGGIVGAIFAGFASDRLFQSRRAPIVVWMMVSLGIVAYFYGTISTWGRVANIVGITLIGFLIYGPDSVTSGAAPVDFGSKRAASAAAGFVNGLGSIGAALSGVVIGYVSKRYGWPAVFNLFGPLSLVGAVFMASMWNARPKS
jgi:sugar phosphate permease